MWSHEATAAYKPMTPADVESLCWMGGPHRHSSGTVAGAGAPASFLHEAQSGRKLACVGGAADFMHALSAFLGAGVPPEKICWKFEAAPGVRQVVPLAALGVPSAHAVLIRGSLMRMVVLASMNVSEERFDLLYALVWHAVHDWRRSDAHARLLLEAQNLRHGVYRELSRLRTRACKRTVAVCDDVLSVVACDAHHLVEEHLACTLMNRDGAPSLLLGPHATVLRAPQGLFAARPVCAFNEDRYPALWAQRRWESAAAEALELFGPHSRKQ